MPKVLQDIWGWKCMHDFNLRLIILVTGILAFATHKTRQPPSSFLAACELRTERLLMLYQHAHLTCRSDVFQLF
ncbi:hypothetical protein K431DRAFT_168140 [Polychaeton citri CBS 116435]|uniref:Uncharacterized protein n=1 Tax=Polychaeton citri CBS 116435 TaxID=1314669 RepID=A0A9P4ULH5_9PEZI|nr:hypothetical protein K431DRAFT_168140 [Polychaeton citri CBS 116435]